MRWIEKIIVTFQNCHDVLQQHAKFGEMELRRAPAVEVKIGVFCMSCLVCLRVGHSSNKYCVTVYGSILMPFSAIFSEGVALSGALYGSHLRRQLCHIFVKLPSKIMTSPKSAEKFVRTTSYFPHVAILRIKQLSKLVRVVQIRFGMNKFVRTKSLTESKFSKIFF